MNGDVLNVINTYHAYTGTYSIDWVAEFGVYCLLDGRWWTVKQTLWFLLRLDVRSSSTICISLEIFVTSFSMYVRGVRSDRTVRQHCFATERVFLVKRLLNIEQGKNGGRSKQIV